MKLKKELESLLLIGNNKFNMYQNELIDLKSDLIDAKIDL